MLGPKCLQIVLLDPLLPLLLLPLSLLVQWRVGVLEADREAGMYVAPLGRFLQQAVVGIAAPPVRIPTAPIPLHGNGRLLPY